MKQSKKHSFIEANFNTFVGLAITLFVNTIVFRIPHFKDMSAFVTIIEYTLIMTVVSIGRNYFTRRFFNKGDVIHFVENKLDKFVLFWYSLFTQSKD